MGIVLWENGDPLHIKSKIYKYYILLLIGKLNVNIS